MFCLFFILKIIFYAFPQCGLSEEDIQIFNIRFEVTAQKGFYGKNYVFK